MRAAITLLLTLALAMPAVGQQALDIYFIDTEGGQATLYVSPSGESMLVDTGNPGERDHGRIMEAIRAAGLRQIDHLFLTHYHGDHHGGLIALAEAIPIRNFYDHGPSAESGRGNIDEFQARYAEITSRATRTIVKPGDRVPFAGVEVTVVASHGETLQSPLQGAPGAGTPNDVCSTHTPKDLSAFPDIDNDYSAGFVLDHGSFRTINLGDFTWNKEFDLMCPTNRIGHVDLYLTSHHGLDRSGAPVLVHALRPRVAIMNNGTRKGGSADALQVLRTSPGLQDIWQLHWSYTAGVEYNTAGVQVANLDAPDVLAAVINPPPQAAAPAGQGSPGGAAPPAAAPGAPGAGPGNAGGAPGAPGPGGPRPPAGPGTPAAHTPAHWIKVSALPDGSFTVTNARNDFSKSYPAH